MTYEVVANRDLEKLEIEVTERLSKGWMLQGGVCVSQSDYYSEDHKGYSNDNFSQIFIQAMIKRDDLRSFP